jgi:TRAP-type mannitol/chloroaromatic compound transport system substrate-binding protein
MLSWLADARPGFVFVVAAKWAELPKTYQQMIRSAAAQVAADVPAKYDARNAGTIKRLVAAGAQRRPFSVEIMDAAFAATNELFAEIGSKNARFKKLNESVTAFRGDQYGWYQVCDLTYDNYMVRKRRT